MAVQHDSTGAGQARTDRFLLSLGRLLDDAGLIVESDVLARYSCDWTGKDRCSPLAVARPKTVDELSRVLAYCHEHSWPVTVQGGLTGLCGGATPRSGEVALSLERLAAIEEFDANADCMTVQAGVTLARVQEIALQQGMSFPLDLASRGSCTIGGNIATNAGGNRVLRYGTARNLVLGLEAVLADGRVLTSLGTVIKDNAGFDLKHYFIGTEGTLGVVTRAALRLYPEPADRLTVLASTTSFSQLRGLLATLRRRLGNRLVAFEAMWDSYFECVLTTLGLTRPFANGYSHYALAEVELLEPEHDRRSVERVLSDCLEKGEIGDAVMSASCADATRLWQFRESAGEMLSRLAPAVGHDVSLPMAKMDVYVETVRARFERELPGGVCVAFGHLGDGNLHFLTALRTAEDAEALDSIVYGELPAGGSISAEHGIGVSKKNWLKVSRTQTEIDLMRGLKAHFDPRAILNRGRVV
jgi:FAD/FMN-containing dehydrogenase